MALLQGTRGFLEKEIPVYFKILMNGNVILRDSTYTV